MNEPRQVEHQPQSRRFIIDAGGAEPAVLAYELTKAGEGGVVNFVHTYVPPALRQQGLAEKLVRAGLTWARAQGLTIEASCWYVQKFLRG